MSSEIVKKRGRPKKIIPELVEVEVPIVAKKTTKAKAVKAATKTVKAKAPATVKTTAAKRVVSKSADEVVDKTIESVKPEHVITQAVELPLKPASEPIASVEKNAPIESAEAEAKAKDIAESPNTTKEAPSVTRSPILAEVQKLREGKALAAAAIKEDAIAAKKPSSPSVQPKPQTPLPQAASPAPKSSPSKPTPSPSPSKPAPPASKPTPLNPKPHIPLAQINSEIVSNITTRAGARPNTAGSKQLPPNYKSVSRKVTMAIVAMPIIIVTSYVLYQRRKYFHDSLRVNLAHDQTVVLGEERKLLVEPIPAPMEPPRAAASVQKDVEPPKTAPSS